MRQNINHTDRVIWVSHYDTIERNVALLAQLTGTKFHGPHVSERLGAQIYMANSAGMQMMAPLPASTAPVARALTRRLETKGEGVFAVVFGVPDLIAAVARARAAGYEPTDFILVAGDEPWAAETGLITGAVVGDVMNVTFIYAEIAYPDHLFPVAGGSPRTTRNNNRLDHFAWVSRPDNLERNVALLAQLGGHPLDGPHGKPQTGIHIALSWETGLEVIAPIPGSEGALAKNAWSLLKDGDGVYAVLFGVSDIAAAMERARAVGYTPGEVIIGGSDKLVPWAGKYEVFQETYVGKVMGTDFMYCLVEYPEHIFVTRPKTARV